MGTNVEFGGLVSVRAVLAGRRRPLVRLYVRRGSSIKGLSQVIEWAQRQGVPVEWVEAGSWSERFAVVDDECVLEAGDRRVTKVGELVERLKSSDSAWVLAVEGVEDPHDLGAVIRTGVAAGVNAVMLPERLANVDPATVARSSAGTSETAEVVAVARLAEGLGELNGAGFRTVAAVPGAKRTLWETDPTGRVVIVIGGEKRGLSRETRDACSEEFSIPMSAGVESLTASACAGAALFEAVRRRTLSAK